jgi:hypothetical protein
MDRMSARDTKRDVGAGPNDTLRNLERPGHEPDDASATQEVATEEVPARQADANPEEEKTGPRRKFDPYRFQANTVPPGMRAELLQAEPEEHPSDLMQDTLPPSHSATRATRSAFSELGDSGIHRAVAPRPGLRPVALVSLSLTAIALAVLVIVAATRPRFRYVSAPNVVRAPGSGVSTTSGVVTVPNGASTMPTAVPEPSAAIAPSAASVPSPGSAPKERRVPPAAARETTPPQKTAGPKSETPARGSKIHPRVDVESPLMP